MLFGKEYHFTIILANLFPRRISKPLTVCTFKHFTISRKGNCFVFCILCFQFVIKYLTQTCQKSINNTFQHEKFVEEKIVKNVM
jgi:hypothetical protein